INRAIRIALPYLVYNRPDVHLFARFGVIGVHQDPGVAGLLREVVQAERTPVGPVHEAAQDNRALCFDKTVPGFPYPDSMNPFYCWAFVSDSRCKRAQKLSFDIPLVEEEVVLDGAGVLLTHKRFHLLRRGGVLSGSCPARESSDACFWSVPRGG